jgi:hypothetical protein
MVSSGPFVTSTRYAGIDGGAQAAGRSDDPLVTTPISQQRSIVSIEVYPASIRVKRAFNGQKPTPPDRSGSELQGFSDKSRGRLGFTARNSAHILRSQFCCTYHNYWPVDGREFKRHLNAFLTAARRAFPFLSYLWVAEFQTRNAPHAHVFLDLPATAENRDILAHIWHRIADPHSPEHLSFHRHHTNMIKWTMGSGSYLCKYLDKQHQKAIPDGFRNFGRWWGNSRGLVAAWDTHTPAGLEDEFPQVDEETGEVHEGNATAYLVRLVGRYHEKKNRRSWFRRTSRTATVLTGAPIFRQALEYLRRTRGGNNNPCPF